MSEHVKEVTRGDAFEEHLKRVRGAEIEVVKPWLGSRMRVLELGGGSGYQASVMASWGCDVVSIDLPDRPAPQTLYYPVQDYNGTNIPYADRSFDIVFSSNVLEHIRPLPPIFAEMQRVLKPKGLAVHLVPSTTWRLWTSLSHYGFVIKLLLGLQQPIPSSANAPSVTKALDRHGLFFVMKRVLLPGPHGEYPSALSELYYFSKKRWLALFKENGFEIEQVTNNGLFYTGNAMLPNLSLETRRIIARFLGAACHVFVAQKSDS